MRTLLVLFNDVRIAIRPQLDSIYMYVCIHICKNIYAYIYIDMYISLHTYVNKMICLDIVSVLKNNPRKVYKNIYVHICVHP